jgi:hypothetical protein
VPDIFVASPKKNSEELAKVTDKLLKKSGNSFLSQMLSSFNYLPDGLRFGTQQENEAVLFLLREHWITNVGWLMMSLILLVTPLFIFPLIMNNGVIPANTPPTFIAVFVLGWYLMTFSYILLNFLHWYFNVWIVTDERIIDIEFVNILSKQFAETRISKIEDVTTRTGGFIRSLFDYGDIVVQTAATQVVFIFTAIPYPDRVVRVINDLMEKAERNT